MVPKNCNIALIYPKKVVPKKARSEIFQKKKKKKIKMKETVAVGETR